MQGLGDVIQNEIHLAFQDPCADVREKGVEKEKSLSWRQEIAKTAKSEENRKSAVAEEGACR